MTQNKELNICKERNARSVTWTAKSETWTLASGCPIKKADDFDLTLKGIGEHRKMITRHQKK